jgi:hypothetical protein
MLYVAIRTRKIRRKRPEIVVFPVICACSATAKIESACAGQGRRRSLVRSVRSRLARSRCESDEN